MQKELSYALAFDDLEQASQQREEVTRRRLLIREIKCFNRLIKKYPSLKSSPLSHELKSFQSSYHLLMTIDIEELQELVERVRLEVRMTEAAIFIQKQYRAYLLRRLAEYKNVCAKKIQD
jgi:hypothetical protein